MIYEQFQNKYLKNNFWLLFDRLFRAFCSLFVGIWIARYLGPKDFGILNYALAFVAFFNVFIDLGLNQIVVRELVKHPKITNYILGTAFRLKFFGTFLAMIGIYVLLFLIKIDNVTKLVIFFLTLRMIFQSVDVIDYFFQAKVISKYTVIARSLAFFISSLLSIYFILNEYSVVYFALSLFVDLLLTALFLIIIYQKNGYILKQWRFSKKIAMNLMKNAWPLALSLFLISIHTKIDQVMIGNMLNITQVGIYSVSVQLSNAWLFFPAILINTYMPYFTNLRKVDKKLYQYQLIQLYSFMFWIGFFVGIVIILFGDIIISLLFGEVYANAYMPLVFNIWNGIFISQAIARGIWMINENLQIYRLYSNIIVVILNVGMNILLIPLYGIIGAAIATLITQAIGTWIISLFWKPLRQSTYDLIKSINPIYIIKFIFR